VLVGLVASLGLAGLGLALLVRAAATEVAGVAGAVGTGPANDVRSGFLAVGLVALTTAAIPYTLCRRLALRLAATAARRDVRPGALLLRAFHDDRLRLRAHRTTRQHPLSRARLSSRDRFEEILVWPLWRRGPVTGLGPPGTRLPPLGATRQFYADHTWHLGVRELISTSALIVVVVDDSRQLAWEIEEIRSQRALGRTVFVVPPVWAAERRHRLRALEGLLGLYPCASVLEQGTEVLALSVGDASGGGSDAEVHAYTSAYRDDLSYEVALDLAAAAGWRPQPAAAAREELSLSWAAPRGSRPLTFHRSYVGWGAVIAISVLTSAAPKLATIYLPGLDEPASRPYDEWIDTGPTQPLRTQPSEAGILTVPMSRQGIAYVRLGTDDGWDYIVGDDDRIRDAALGRAAVAVATVESDMVVLLSLADGHERARVDLGEAATSLVVTDRYVIAARPLAGDVLVADHDGEFVRTVDVEGTPTVLATADSRIVVEATGTSALQLVEPETGKRESVEVGDGLRGLATAGSTAYVTRPDEREVIAVDVAAGRVVSRTQLAEIPLSLSPLAPFDPMVAADGDHLVVPVWADPGRAGIAVFDASTLRRTEVIWTSPYGAPIGLHIVNGVVGMGSSRTGGVYVWLLQSG
jgi:hypothetical protein